MRDGRWLLHLIGVQRAHALADDYAEPAHMRTENEKTPGQPPLAVTTGQNVRCGPTSTPGCHAGTCKWETIRYALDSTPRTLRLCLILLVFSFSRSFARS